MDLTALHAKSDREIGRGRASSDALSVKISTVVLALGATYLTAAALTRAYRVGPRRRSLMEHQAVPPVRPQSWTSPAVGV